MTWKYGITLSKCAVWLWRPDGPYPTAAGPGSHGVTLWMHISCLYPAGLAQQHTDTHETRELADHQVEEWAGGEKQDQLQEGDRVMPSWGPELPHLHALLLQGVLRVLHEVLHGGSGPVSSGHVLTKAG